MERNRQGWKCGTCRIMNKKNAEYCQRCGGYWTECFEDQHQWNWAAASEPKSPRPRSNSARRRTQTKSAGKGGKGPGKDHSKGTGGKVAQSPFSNSSYVPTPEALTPWPCMDFEKYQQAPAPAPSQPSNQSAQELVLALRKAFPESSALPQSLRDAMERAESSGVRQITKDLHAATSSLGRARKAHQEASEARSKLKSSWMKHLQESIQAWDQQLDTYRKNMAKLQDTEAKALQEVANAKRMIQQLNSQSEGSGFEEPASMEEPPDANQDKEEERLRQQLQDTMTTCLSTVGVTPKTEVLEITSDGEGEEKGQKRPRAGTNTNPAAKAIATPT